MTDEKKFEPPLVVDSDHAYEIKEWRKERSCAQCHQKIGTEHRRSCGVSLDAYREFSIPHTDLRGVTRSPESCLATVDLIYGSDRRYRWITCGQVALRHHNSMHKTELTCYLKAGVTDAEHDSAYAFILPLIGWTFDSVYYHRTKFRAWIHPNADSFQVPGPGYDPAGAPDVYRCESEHCTDKHEMVEYLPPDNGVLYKRVRGKQVLITIGPAKDE